MWLGKRYAGIAREGVNGASAALALGGRDQRFMGYPLRNRKLWMICRGHQQFNFAEFKSALPIKVMYVHKSLTRSTDANSHESVDLENRIGIHVVRRSLKTYYLTVMCWYKCMDGKRSKH